MSMRTSAVISRHPVGWRVWTAAVTGCLLVAGCGGDAEPASQPIEQATAVQATAEPISAATSAPVPTVAVPTEVRPTDVPATDTARPEPSATVAEPTAVPATAVPDKFLRLDPGADRDCDEFDSQAEAQSYWDYYRSDERPNPGRLDGNGNGIVCEAGVDSGAQAPPQPAVPEQPAAAPSRPCDTSLTCDDFGSWQEMFTWWDACGRPDKYDKNGDGIPCEGLRE